MTLNRPRRRTRSLLLTQITATTPLLELFKAMRAGTTVERSSRWDHGGAAMEKPSKHRRHGRCPRRETTLDRDPTSPNSTAPDPN